MNAAKKKERQFNMLFRTKEEKLAAAAFALDQRNFPSLNSYFLHLYREDRRRFEKPAQPPAQTEAGQRH